MLVMTPDEYNKLCGYDYAIEEVKLLDADVEFVILSNDDDCPFAVTKYVDGRYAIVGCGYDSEITEEEVAIYLGE